MKKVLVILLCLFTLTSLLTTASVSSQRNAWKKEAEKSWKDQDRLTEKYEEYQQQAEEEIASLTTERDAFSLLTQAIEAENVVLRQEVEQLKQALQDSTAALEEQLNQANADKAFAEQRLQEALDILLTPTPALSPTPQPPASPAPDATRSPLGLMEGESFAMQVAERFIQCLPTPGLEATEDMQTLLTEATPAPQETEIPAE